MSINKFYFILDAQERRKVLEYYLKNIRPKVKKKNKESYYNPSEEYEGYKRVYFYEEDEIKEELQAWVTENIKAKRNGKLVSIPKKIKGAKFQVRCRCNSLSEEIEIRRIIAQSRPLGERVIWVGVTYDEYVALVKSFISLYSQKDAERIFGKANVRRVMEYEKLS